jgi:hypothetical protein
MEHAKCCSNNEGESYFGVKLIPATRAASMLADQLTLQRVAGAHFPHEAYRAASSNKLELRREPILS